MRRAFLLIICMVCLTLSSTGAELKQKTNTAFDKYVSATESRINSELRPGGVFLYVDGLPDDARQRSRDRLMKGDVLVEQRKTTSPGSSSDVPDGMVHHWIGIIFIPGVKLPQVLSLVHYYDRRAEIYKP